MRKGDHHLHPFMVTLWAIPLRLTMSTTLEHYLGGGPPVCGRQLELSSALCLGALSKAPRRGIWAAIGTLAPPCGRKRLFRKPRRKPPVRMPVFSL
jgi:hypothetical protein